MLTREVFKNFEIEQSRKDDLEAISYLIIYFLKGKLPWQGLNPDNSTNPLALIERVKITTPLEILCEGLPIEISEFVTYSRDLEFTAKPDYKYWRDKFKRLFEKNKFKNDNIWDWSQGVYLKPFSRQI